MKWNEKLVEGQLLKRYKRFFADVEISGETVVAHVPNTGSLKSVLETGQRCWLSPSSNPERKLKFTLEAVQPGSGAWVGVNTTWPNQLAREAFELGKIPHWKKFASLQSEVKIHEKSRLDLLLQSESGKKHFVEIKNVTYKMQDSARFPDAVSERGQKHLQDLISLVQQGHSAEIFYTVQRTDVKSFSPADEIDPTYADLLRKAKQTGVRISAFIVEMNPQEIFLSGGELEVQL